MILITPTITADNAHTYREQIERVSGIADRIHIDLADGVFAPTKLINPIQVWWPDNLVADIHLMYQQPEQHIETLISLKPSLVILHVEADGNILGLLRELKAVGIKPGVALLQNTQPEDYSNEIAAADHALIFGGHLGYHGGEAQLNNLEKVKSIKQLNPSIELSWDGGVNDKNAKEIVDKGINVLNVGGFIQKSDAPQDAYDIIQKSIKQ